MEEELDGIDEPVSDIISYPVSMEQFSAFFCRFNNGVNCYDKSKCSKCGWNSEVSNIRAAKIRTHIKTYGLNA